MVTQGFSMRKPRRRRTFISNPSANRSNHSGNRSKGRIGRVNRSRRRIKSPFVEVAVPESDFGKLIGRKIEIYWGNDDAWYPGFIKKYDPTNRLHLVVYKDKEEEWISLVRDKYRIQILSPREFGSASQSGQADVEATSAGACFARENDVEDTHEENIGGKQKRYGKDFSDVGGGREYRRVRERKADTLQEVLKAGIRTERKRKLAFEDVSASKRPERPKEQEYTGSSIDSLPEMQNVESRNDGEALFKMINRGNLLGKTPPYSNCFANVYTSMRSRSRLRRQSTESAGSHPRCSMNNGNDISAAGEESRAAVVATSVVSELGCGKFCESESSSRMFRYKYSRRKRLKSSNEKDGVEARGAGRSHSQVVGGDSSGNLCREIVPWRPLVITRISAKSFSTFQYVEQPLHDFQEGVKLAAGFEMAPRLNSPLRLKSREPFFLPFIAPALQLSKPYNQRNSTQKEIIKAVQSIMLSWLKANLTDSVLLSFCSLFLQRDNSIYRHSKHVNKISSLQIVDFILKKIDANIHIQSHYRVPKFDLTFADSPPFFQSLHYRVTLGRAFHPLTFRYCASLSRDLSKQMQQVYSQKPIINRYPSTHLVPTLSEMSPLLMPPASAMLETPRTLYSRPFRTVVQPYAMSSVMPIKPKSVELLRSQFGMDSSLTKLKFKKKLNSGSWRFVSLRSPFQAVTMEVNNTMDYYSGIPSTSSQPRKRGRRGRPPKRDKFKNPQEIVMSRSCFANILCSQGDGCVREVGAYVVLEEVSSGQWALNVKVNGLTRFTHKPDEPRVRRANDQKIKGEDEDRPHTSNRPVSFYMIWAGAKDWSLEFIDKNQWYMFRKLYEDCYFRNLRTPYVTKSIPVPGVSETDDYRHLEMQTPFVRPQSYIKTPEDEVQRLLHANRIIYDMDSDDENCMNEFNRNNFESYGTDVLSADAFERIIDTLEKTAFTRRVTSLTTDEALICCDGIGPASAVIAVHEHWLRKREKKKKPLFLEFLITQPDENQPPKRRKVESSRGLKKRNRGKQIGQPSQSTFSGSDHTIPSSRFKTRAYRSDSSSGGTPGHNGFTGLHSETEGKSYLNLKTEMVSAKQRRLYELHRKAEIAIFKASVFITIAEEMKASQPPRFQENLLFDERNVDNTDDSIPSADCLVNNTDSLRALTW
eukprot:TRINITY_DN15825_c0_g1_i1.p1 TRINITY_DN15825_c0_g1~~TRINITY_DN15825_c0_g1_i1.p1  ORF type:complete len:1155 (-),score=185.98 TRINITY_DN15825_c0_g1_i1:365-3829(-)